ncbi:MAG: AMP-binding protein [Candidatus Bipolaricaulota bacterium]
MIEVYPSIPEVFARSAKLHGEQVAIRIPAAKGRHISYRQATYRELWELSGRMAAWLSAQGVREADRVGLLGKPTVSWAIAFYAVQRLGAVAVPLDAGLQPAEVSRILGEAEAKVFICSPQRYEEFLPLRKNVPSLEEIVAMDTSPGTMSLWDILPDMVEKAPDARPEAKELAVLMYTSGTTGDAKGVMLSHKNLTSNVEALLKVLNISSSDRIVTIVPWHHIYGLTTTLLTPVSAGAQVTYTDDYRNLLEVIQRVECTILVGVPKLYHALWRRMKENIDGNGVRRLLHRFAPRLLGVFLKRRVLGPSFRFFASGGAPLAPEVGAALRRLGLGVSEGYGLTETSPILTFCEPFTRKAGTVGWPLPGVELRIDGRDAEGYGDVLARGPNISAGYYKNEQRTAEAFTQDGWFRTGDVGRIDEEGCLFLKGRKKHVIVLETGKNVYPEELEWEFHQIPEVEEVLVYERESGGRSTVAAMVYPNWDLLSQQAIKTKEAAHEFLWNKVKDAQNNMAAFKRLKGKEDLTLVDEPFEKSIKLEIKRHIYTKQS